MSEAFYRVVRAVGRPVIGIASQARVLHRERVPRRGPFLLVANHESVFDAMLLIAATPRTVHWLANHEVFARPFGRWFFTGMMARPLNRGVADTGAVRTILRDLRAGRAVGIFPQGSVRPPGEIVALGGRFPESLARLAETATVPLVPCIILGAAAFGRWPSWLPGRRTRWVAAYGEPLTLRSDLPPTEARAALLEELARALLALHAEAQPYA